MKKRFYLDRQNKKLLGVSAGIADYTGVDATIVRVALVLLTIAGGFPWTIIAYLIAAAAAKPRPIGDGRESIGKIGGSTYDLRVDMRDIDRRIAEVDTYVAGSNSRLAREIEELR
jgi:phage shock protein C